MRVAIMLEVFDPDVIVGDGSRGKARPPLVRRRREFPDNRLREEGRRRDLALRFQGLEVFQLVRVIREATTFITFIANVLKVTGSVDPVIFGAGVTRAQRTRIPRLRRDTSV